MPCDSSAGMDSGTDYNAQRRIAGLVTQVDELTGMLCSLLRTLDNAVQLPPDIAEWYHKHREWDRSRGRP